MSANRLVLEGLDELRHALRQLPADLAGEAAGIVTSAANRAADAIRQAYPDGGTGKLKAGVGVSTESQVFGAVAIVKSRSPHAAIYEYGTQVRRTAKGWNRGKAPAGPHGGPVGPTVIPIAIRERRRMNQDLIELVKRAGFQVSGSL